MALDTELQELGQGIDMADKREYKITIGIRSYWITEEEKNIYLNDIKNPNIDHVALRGGLLIIPNKFQDIVHRSVIEDSEKIDKGKWKCEYGKWHPNEVECYCGEDWVETDEGTMRLVKVAPHLLEQKKELAPDKRMVPRMNIKTF